MPTHYLARNVTKTAMDKLHILVRPLPTKPATNATKSRVKAFICNSCHRDLGLKYYEEECLNIMELKARLWSWRASLCPMM
jgi:hypothetical protein